MFMERRTFQTDIAEKNITRETSITCSWEEIIKIKSKLDWCDLHVFPSQCVYQQQQRTEPWTFKKRQARIFRNDFNKFIKGKPVPEKCKIVAATSLRKETSFEKCGNFCGRSVRKICGEIVKHFTDKDYRLLINWKQIVNQKHHVNYPLYYARLFRL